jgi:hypothetical protein
MNKVFLTFADSRLKRSLKRIVQEAEDMGCYSSVIAFTEDDLAPEFRDTFKEKLKPSVRGFGYWCWKPQIIKQVLANLNEGDILHYCDVGCHLNLGGKKRLQEYFDITSQSVSGILAFQAKKPSDPFQYDGRPLLDLRDRLWIKGDLLDYFHVRDQVDVIETQSIGAGIFFIKKNDATMAMIDKWLKVYRSQFFLVDDSRSIAPNLDGFLENRHDQSIFSILCKLNQVETISAYEYWYPSRYNLSTPDWAALKDYPIWAIRDKDFGFIGNLQMWISAKFESLIKKLRT